MEIEHLLNELKQNPSEDFESVTLEFKHYNSEKSMHGSKELTEEISALANTDGGNIIVGVKDSCNISNQNWIEQLDGFEKIDINLARERLAGKLNPRYDIVLSEYEFEGKNYLIISVPKSKNTLVATSNGKICVRVGRSSMPAAPHEVERLVKSLHSYDWSDEDVELDFMTALDTQALKAAKAGFALKRDIPVESITETSFLESIGATKNGVLNKAGLLFLGKPNLIRDYLGNYEYRFSWKTKSGELRENKVWSDNIWNTLKKTQLLFQKHNHQWDYEFESSTYTLFTLDKVAFHEGYLNAIVHRDYNEDGMLSVNYFRDKIVISNPGKFYGGVNSSNISYHEPRHRNKTLAKILMEYQLVDRAGMGITRMSVNSLKYGRKMPVFVEKPEGIEVTMQSEFFRAGIFLITQKYVPNCGIVELLILNSIFETGYVSVTELEKLISNLVENPWEEILTSVEEEPFKNYVELKANNSGIYVCPKRQYNYFFDVTKPMSITSNSDKHIKLFKFLKTHGEANNETIMSHLGYKSAGATSSLLKKAQYTLNKGKSRNSKWYLK